MDSSALNENEIGWRHWYHITLGTYGRWLPGDDRGWCERNHRRHVPGTRARPPAATPRSQALHAYAKRVMTREPFSFKREQFPTVGMHLLHSLQLQQCAVLRLSVQGAHCHLLVQCNDDEPRECCGKLKSHVYHRMFKGMATPWEKGSHEEPIADRAHALSVFHYILEHKTEGAWVWSFRDGGGGSSILGLSVGV